MAEWLRRYTAEVAAVARQMAPRKTGALRDSIVPRVTQQAGGLIGEVVAGVPYAIYVHNGTSAHEITAVNASVLSFPSGGMQVFTPRVDHPGTKANPFLLDALVAVTRRR